MGASGPFFGDLEASAFSIVWWGADPIDEAPLRGPWSESDWPGTAVDNVAGDDD